jgi:hypothetical protein
MPSGAMAARALRHRRRGFGNPRPPGRRNLGHPGGRPVRQPGSLQGRCGALGPVSDPVGRCGLRRALCVHHLLCRDADHQPFLSAARIGAGRTARAGCVGTRPRIGDADPSGRVGTARPRRQPVASFGRTQFGGRDRRGALQPGAGPGPDGAEGKRATCRRPAGGKAACRRREFGQDAVPDEYLARAADAAERHRRFLRSAPQPDQQTRQRDNGDAGRGHGKADRLFIGDRGFRTTPAQADPRGAGLRPDRRQQLRIERSRLRPICAGDGSMRVVGTVHGGRQARRPAFLRTGSFLPVRRPPGSSAGRAECGIQRHKVFCRWRQDRNPCL